MQNDHFWSKTLHHTAISYKKSILILILNHLNNSTFLLILPQFVRKNDRWQPDAINRSSNDLISRAETFKLYTFHFCDSLACQVVVANRTGNSKPQAQPESKLLFLTMIEFAFDWTDHLQWNCERVNQNWLTPYHGAHTNTFINSSSGPGVCNLAAMPAIMSISPPLSPLSIFWLTSVSLQSFT